MAINFIPNDPRAGNTAPPTRDKTATANRSAQRSGFNFSNTSPQGKAEPGTPQFLFWQTREAAILALKAFEGSTGKPHTRWQGNRARIDLKQDEGEDLNAFYDRSSFSFFHQAIGAKTFFSGASTDVVAHEVGHGLLDALRPDFFDVSFLEVGAFHEAFGDCMAILTALHDKATRVALLQGGPNLRRANFVEATAEELSFAIGRLVPGHNASAPRRASNKFRYQIPSTLPNNGGPGVLINEVHSFGMVFSGCFWDLIANLFDAAAQKNEAALLAAARMAGKITIAGAAQVVVKPRFMQSIGRAMVLADDSLHGGAHRAAIGDAFTAHGILLGTNAMLSPTIALAGAAPRGGKLPAAARQDLMRRMDMASGAKLAVSAVDMGGVEAVSATHVRSVALGQLAPQLKGVVALAPERVTVGATGSRAAVMGALPNAVDTESEVLEFVQMLLTHRRLLLPGKGADSAEGRSHPEHATHAVKSVGGKKVLARVRFACACHAGPLLSGGHCGSAAHGG